MTLNVMSQSSKQVAEWSHTILTLVSLTSIAFIRVGGRSSSVCTRTKQSQYSINMFHCICKHNICQQLKETDCNSLMGRICTGLLSSVPPSRR